MKNDTEKKLKQTKNRKRTKKYNKSKYITIIGGPRIKRGSW